MDDALRRLARAVLIRAARDARSDAATFRAYPSTRAVISAWAQVAGIDARTVLGVIYPDAAARRKGACRRKKSPESLAL